MRLPKELIAEVKSILEIVRHALPDENVTDALELLEYNEWGEALLLICTQLYEYKIVIDSNVYNRIATVGTEIQLPPKEWEMLKELIS